MNFVPPISFFLALCRSTTHMSSMLSLFVVVTCDVVDVFFMNGRYSKSLAAASKACMACPQRKDRDRNKMHAKEGGRSAVCFAFV